MSSKRNTYLRECDYVVTDNSRDSVRPSIAAALIFVILLFCATFDADSATSETATFAVYRGSTVVERPASIELCRSRAAALEEITPKSSHVCRVSYTMVKTGPTTPTCTAPRPPADTRVATCPAPTVGTYGQKREHVAAPYPTCWADGTEWVNVDDPARVCVQPPTQTNRAPTINGSPPSTGTAGLVYSFTPTASDPDGNPLAFTIINRPRWATLNASTGQLTGTPTANDVAFHSDIAITVSDGRLTASLPPFSISVKAAGTTPPDPPDPAPGTGSATLTWQRPELNTDNTPLTNLAGYRIVYGTTQSQLTQTLTVSNPSAQSYVITGLAPATWYFALMAYTSSGAESAASDIASKRIQ